MVVVASPKQVRERSQGPKLPQLPFDEQVVATFGWIRGKYCRPTLIPADMRIVEERAPSRVRTAAHLVGPAAVVSVIEPELSIIM